MSYLDLLLLFVIIYLLQRNYQLGRKISQQQATFIGYLKELDAKNKRLSSEIVRLKKQLKK